MHETWVQRNKIIEFRKKFEKAYYNLPQGYSGMVVQIYINSVFEINAFFLTIIARLSIFLSCSYFFSKISASYSHKIVLIKKVY